MNRKKDLTLLTTLVCSAIISVAGTGAYASDSVNTESSEIFTDNAHTPARHKVAQAQRSKCRRNGVVWSGGIASRFSDRIRPRPVRSRWDREADSSVGCADVNAFKRYRVSEQPWIR